MTTHILELRDSGVQLWSEGELVHASPGYALHHNGQLVFGEPAMAQARLHPRAVENRYWSELSLDPLKADFGGKRHFADLAHAHLLDIAAQSGLDGDTIILVPANFRREQLALLLGILKASPFTAVGLVDGAVAASANSSPPGRSRLLDLQLHAAVLTQLNNEDGVQSRIESTPLPGLGLIALKERVAAAISAAFIEQTRFDPRHTASVEQDLFDQIPQILELLDTESEVKIELGGYVARVDTDHMAEACADFFSRIKEALNGASDQLLLCGHLKIQPGIARLAENGIYISPDAAAIAIAQHSEALHQQAESLDYVTTLPSGYVGEAEPATSEMPDTPVPAAIPASAPEVQTQATHLLYRHHAHALQDTTSIGPGAACTVQVSAEVELLISRRNDQLIFSLQSGEGVSVNGLPAVSGQTLNRADLLMLGTSGEVIQLISVQVADGP
jgi:hypothetical protein